MNLIIQTSCLLILLAYLIVRGGGTGTSKQQAEDELDVTNQAVIGSGEYDDTEMLENKLESYKQQFMEFDVDSSGNIDLMELKMLMEKLDQAKTHLELKKMISEVDHDNTGTISYNEFLEMMLGKKSSVLKLILKFAEAMKGKQNSGSALS